MLKIERDKKAFVTLAVMPLSDVAGLPWCLYGRGRRNRRNRT